MKSKVLFNLGKSRFEGELIKVNSKTVLVKLESGHTILRHIEKDKVEFLKLVLK